MLSLYNVCPRCLEREVLSILEFIWEGVKRPPGLQMLL